MKCKYCGNECGFFKSYHKECEDKVDVIVSKISDVVYDYDQGKISGMEGRNALINIVRNEPLYKDFLWRSLYDKSAVKGNEVILFYEDYIKVCEKKNRCKMMDTGYRWEKMPVWNESNVKLSDSARILFSDQAIYLIFDGISMRYPYGKIVNIGHEEVLKNAQAYFDVKTTSPFPHRFYLIPNQKTEKYKAEILYLFLNCVVGFKHE